MTYGGSGIISRNFTSALDGNERSASRSIRFKIITQLKGGLVDSRANLHTMAKRTILDLPEVEPQIPVRPV
jgi:hypothetical protein